jgi:hypothetical protein
MQALSALLFLAVLCLVIAGVTKIRNHDLLAGTQLIASMFIPLFFLLGFTWRTTCKVKTTRSKPCGNEAYGFLFGCNKTVGHFLGKFLVRLGLQRDAVRHVERSYAVTYDTTSQVRPIKVTIEDNGLGVCGFWVGVISAAAGVIQVITSFTVH